jgi:hypothetical protein
MVLVRLAIMTRDSYANDGTYSSVESLLDRVYLEGEGEFEQKATTTRFNSTTDFIRWHKIFKEFKGDYKDLT